MGPHAIVDEGLPAPDPANVTAVMDALRRIVRALRVSAREAEKRTGLTVARLFVLQKLAEAPASSLRELARRTMTDPSSVSVVVGELERAGWVARKSSPVDARRAEIALTAAGRRGLKRAPQAAQSRLIGALEALPAMQLASLRVGLDAVVVRMGIAGEEAKLFFEDDPPAPKKRTKEALS